MEVRKYRRVPRAERSPARVVSLVVVSGYVRLVWAVAGLRGVNGTRIAYRHDTPVRLVFRRPVDR